MISNSTENTAENKQNGETALLSPDGRLLAVPVENNTLVVIDVLTNELWVTYYGHQAGLSRPVSGIIKALLLRGTLQRRGKLLLKCATIIQMQSFGCAASRAFTRLLPAIVLHC